MFLSLCYIYSWIQKSLQKFYSQCLKYYDCIVTISIQGKQKQMEYLICDV